MKHIGFIFATTLVLACNSNSGGGGGGGGSDEGGGGGNAGSGGKGGGAGGAKMGGNAGSTPIAGNGGGTGGAKGGAGGTAGSGGVAGGGGVAAPDFTKVPGCTELEGIVRDFQSTHPDFQFPNSNPAIWPVGTTGMIQPTLGANKKPVLLPAGVGLMGIAASVDSFNEWFNDKAGVNMAIPVKLPVKQISATLFEFGPTDIDGNFFPIDNKGFGNQDFKAPDVAGDVIEDALDMQHNQLLTLELHSEFLYQGGKGEMIVSRTDDDSWIFINGKLAVDDGGLAQDLVTLKLDDVAATLGLEPGKKYPISIFFADRQLVLAILRLSSNIIWTGCAK